MGTPVHNTIRNSATRNSATHHLTPHHGSTAKNSVTRVSHTHPGSTTQIRKSTTRVHQSHSSHHHHHGDELRETQTEGRRSITKEEVNRGDPKVCESLVTGCGPEIVVEEIRGEPREINRIERYNFL